MALVRFFRRLHLEPWQRNLYIVVASQASVLVGFGIATPFLPFFIQELGVTRFDEVAFWTGFINSAPPLAQAAVAPIWGMLADRYGRKPMLVRSLLGGGIMFVLTALFVQTVPQLAVFRIVQMILAGSQTAATILVATTVPREQCGFGLGLVQMAAFFGHSVGPLIGGVIGATLGYRMAFMVAGILVLVTGALVIAFVKERFEAPQRTVKKSNPFKATFGLMLVQPVLLSMVTLELFNNLSNSVTRPMLPLFVQTLTPSASEAATATGLIVGASAMANAAAAVIFGKMADRLGRRKVLIACVTVASVLHLPQMFTTHPMQLLILRVLVGLAAGGLVPVANAVIAEHATEGRQGAIFGLSASLNAFGRALGPMLGTVVATSWSVGGVFAVTGIMLGLVAIMVTFTTRAMIAPQVAVTPSITATSKGEAE